MCENSNSQEKGKQSNEFLNILTTKNLVFYSSSTSNFFRLWNICI